MMLCIAGEGELTLRLVLLLESRAKCCEHEGSGCGLQVALRWCCEADVWRRV